MFFELINNRVIAIFLILFAISSETFCESVGNVNKLNADGSFIFKTTQDGNSIDIVGSIQSKDGYSWLKLEGKYIFGDHSIKFTVDRNKYRVEDFEDDDIETTTQALF